MISMIGYSSSHNSHKKDTVKTLSYLHIHCTMHTLLCIIHAYYIQNIVLSIHTKQEIYVFLEITITYL